MDYENKLIKKINDFDLEKYNMFSTDWGLIDLLIVPDNIEKLLEPTWNKPKKSQYKNNLKTFHYDSYEYNQDWIRNIEIYNKFIHNFLKYNYNSKDKEYIQFCENYCKDWRSVNITNKDKLKHRIELLKNYNKQHNKQTNYYINQENKNKYH